MRRARSLNHSQGSFGASSPPLCRQLYSAERIESCFSLDFLKKYMQKAPRKPGAFCMGKCRFRPPLKAVSALCRFGSVQTVKSLCLLLFLRQSGAERLRGRKSKSVSVLDTLFFLRMHNILCVDTFKDLSDVFPLAQNHDDILRFQDGVGVCL